MVTDVPGLTGLRYAPARIRTPGLKVRNLSLSLTKKPKVLRYPS